MSKNFQRANLRGHSFIGQDYRNANFSYADIRGANFTNAILIGANFSHAKTGLRIWWSIGLAITSIFLALLAGFTAGYASAFGAYVRNLPAEYTLLEQQLLPLLAIGVLALLLFILLRRGLGVTLSAFALILAISIVLMAAVANIVIDIVIMVTTLLFALIIAAAIGSVVVGAVALALSLGMLQRWLIALVCLIALAGAVPGAWEGVSGMTAKISFGESVLVALITIALLATSSYIGRQAMLNDKRYALIRTLTITLLSKGGTSFYGANLTDALFTHAQLPHADLRSAVLIRTDWFSAQQLAHARTESTYLANPSIQELVASKDGHNKNFDYLDLRGINLQTANLTNASFIGSNLSEATFEDADLSRSKLVHAQLYAANLRRACLTGAYIEEWGISTNTHLDQIKCDYIHMHLPTEQDQETYRKPDNRQEIFKEGDFSDFITPIIKTLALYRQQNIDLRNLGKAFKTLDLFHSEGVDPSATIIALKQLAEQHPEAGLEVVAVQGRGEKNIHLQANISHDTDSSQLSEEYLARYNQLKSLPYTDIQILLTEIREKDKRIQSLENIIETALKSEKFYAETHYNFGEIKIDHQTNTGGGFAIGGNVNTTGDFVGRDKIA